MDRQLILCSGTFDVMQQKPLWSYTTQFFILHVACVILSHKLQNYLSIPRPKQWSLSLMYAYATMDKAIGSVYLSVINTKITRSRTLGIWATCKHNKSIKVVKKLAPLCFKSLGKAHECRKTGVFVGHTSTAPTYAFCLCIQPSRECR